MGKLAKLVATYLLAADVGLCLFSLSMAGCGKTETDAAEVDRPSTPADPEQNGTAEADDTDSGRQTTTAHPGGEREQNDSGTHGLRDGRTASETDGADGATDSGYREHAPDGSGIPDGSATRQDGSDVTCGNGRLDEGELCDDGNQRNGDGCSLGCQCQDSEIVGDFSIDSVDDLDSFIDMISEHGCVVLKGNISLSVTWVEETGRTDLNGFESLTAVEGDFQIASNSHAVKFPVPTLVKFLCLTTLDGLDNLDHIGGSLDILNCIELNSIDALDDISYIGCNPDTDIRVTDTGVPTEDVVSLKSRQTSRPLCTDGVLTCDPFWINTPDDVARLSNCRWASGDLRISNSALSNLEGLENLESIDGALLIFENDSLVNLNGLDNLRSVGRLDISRNPLLEDVGPICDVNEDGYIESVIISKNSSLTDICDLKFTEVGRMAIWTSVFPDLGFLNRINALEESLSISSNDLLVDLKGLDSLTSVGGLQIDHNASLQNLEGLNNLAHVTSIIDITGNKSLTSLRALKNVPSLGGNLWVRDNTSLPTCEAIWLRDTIGFFDISGEIDIDGNDDSGVCSE